MKKVLTFAIIAALGGAGVGFAQQARGPFGPGKLFERIDENHDGKVARNELSAGLDRLFAEADANKDGKVTRDELAAMHGAHAGGKGDWLKKADENGDGKLERSEVPDMPQRFFDRLDQNHDGVVDAAELARKHEGRHPFGDRMFAHLDSNGDGAVDAAELKAAATKRFERVDANHDGVVDQDELRSARGRFFSGHCHGEERAPEGGAAGSRG